MVNIIVMYHYVRDNTNLKAFSTKEFRMQLEYLKKKYKIISIKDLLKDDCKNSSCVLTFDDGIKDGFTNVLPILKEYKLKASFFIPTQILNKERILEAQKRHLLLAKLGTERFVEEFNNLAEDTFQIRKEGKKNSYDDELTSNLKYVLDYMDQKKSKKIIKKIFDKYLDEKEEFEKIYLNRDEIRNMKEEGMEIGSHGHRHLRLGNLYYKDMKKDMIKSVKVFEKKLFEHPLIMSYPFGSYSLFTRRLAEKIGFIAGITILKQKNKSLSNCFELGRYDCIDLFPRPDRYKI